MAKGKTKQILKKIKKQKEKYEQLVKKEQSCCPHVKKSGAPLLRPITDNSGDETQRSRCERCGAIVVTDKELLQPDYVKLSVEVVQSVLSAVKAQAHTGAIKMDDKLMDVITKMETDVLPDLPEFITKINQTDDADDSYSCTYGKKKKHNGKNKKKDGKKKKNKRERRF